jgi:hypothetical protein
MTKRLSGKEDYALVLRACNTDMTSYRGFKYPKKGRVTCPDWKKNYECGNGLHGFLWGIGDRILVPTYSYPRGTWLVIKVKKTDLIHLCGKVKFRTGTVVFCGRKEAAGSYIRARRPTTSHNVWYEIIKPRKR